MNQNNDIKDDEIRIISSGSETSAQNHSYNISAEKRKRTVRIILVLSSIILVIVILALLFFMKFSYSGDNDDNRTIATTLTPTTVKKSMEGYVDISDTIVNGNRYTILYPVNATPSLHVGLDILSGDSAVLIAKAADIRADNQEIAGTFVDKGKLLSKGEAKSGFCAIINGNLILGTAKSTPYLEEALEQDGYFFRQYPLVAGGQAVENKPRGKSFRKALALIDGENAVIISNSRISFHEFSEALVELGASEAIYLTGSTTYGYALDKDGNKFEFGNKSTSNYPNSNFIVWQ